MAPTNNPKNIVGDFKDVEPVNCADSINTNTISQPKQQMKPYKNSLI